jgi:hypothetical protein
MPPLFFISYARADVEFPPYREDLAAFVEALSAKVADRTARPMNGLRFFDATSIETGEIWTTELTAAVARTRVAVPLYSMNYFTRPWCGKEYEIFRRRRRTAGQSGVVPVLWVKCTTLPDGVEQVQYRDAAFPAEYSQVGMRQLRRLKSYADQYEMALEALADRIVAAANPGLLELDPATLDFGSVPSAWDVASDRDPKSHTEGRVSKTCFVFVSRHGWDWQPYPAASKTIGALAQEVSGALGLRYEEIKCDNTLTRKLGETYEAHVPTVLFGDPDSLIDHHFAKPMQDYDTQFLLNCAALVAWDESSRMAGEADLRWQHLRREIFPQKTEVPPPHHEWRTIFTLDDLEAKTRTTIEQLRSRLLKQILSQPPELESDQPSRFRKAEDPRASDEAAALGIPTGAPAQLEGPNR